MSKQDAKFKLGDTVRVYMGVEGKVQRVNTSRYGEPVYEVLGELYSEEHIAKYSKTMTVSIWDLVSVYTGIVFPPPDRDWINPRQLSEYLSGQTQLVLQFPWLEDVDLYPITGLSDRDAARVIEHNESVIQSLIEEHGETFTFWIEYAQLGA